MSPSEKTGCNKNNYYTESPVNERQKGVRDKEPGTGWNPSQATFYLELSSDDWLVVYKDPCSTELIKPTSIAFQSQQRTSGCN